jgi:uncharacterized membrane protein YtjA (UPF0391 family)
MCRQAMRFIVGAHSADYLRGNAAISGRSASRGMPSYKHTAAAPMPPGAHALLSSAQQRCRCAAQHPERAMLHYAVIFFVIALIAALFGFGGIAAGASGIAQTLFFVFIVLAVITFVWNLVKGKS